MRLHGIILSKILDKPQFNFAYHPKCIHNWEYLELDPLGIIPMSNAEVTGVLEYLKTNIGKASFTNQKSNQSCTQNFQKTFFKW
jgi:polysaccharide pyruvyl transferase WcaK-like protein